MRQAIDLARSHQPHPNPRVGAVILRPDGSVRSSGAHRDVGMPHAERVAIAAGVEPGDTLVVTLEPCNHEGSTPPCTDAIIDTGIAKVVVGAVDPDERVSGAGIARLRDAGIDVDLGILAAEVEAMDRAYFHHRRTGRARATLKVASTLDGQVAAADGTSRWITSRAARTEVHRLRAEHDAVLVGIGTVVSDDPALDVRLDGYDGRQPLPVVLTGRRSIPDGARIARRDPLAIGGPSGADPESVVHALPEHGALSVLIEGGPTVSRAFLDAGVVDEIIWYVGARLAGGVGRPAIGGTFETIAGARTLDITDVARVGPDVRITATLSHDTEEDPCSRAS